MTAAHSHCPSLSAGCSATLHQTRSVVPHVVPQSETYLSLPGWCTSDCSDGPLYHRQRQRLPRLEHKPGSPADLSDRHLSEFLCHLTSFDNTCGPLGIRTKHLDGKMRIDRGDDRPQGPGLGGTDQGHPSAILMRRGATHRHGIRAERSVDVSRGLSSGCSSSTRTAPSMPPGRPSAR